MHPRFAFPVPALLLFCLWLIASGGALHAQPLNSQLQDLANRGAASRAVWGIYAVELESGNVLADINGTRLHVPASNRKLVTTALAARRFRPDQRIETELRAERLASGGVVEGDLVLYAAGDPSWTAELQSGRTGIAHLRTLARAAHQAGLRRVEGDLVIDTGLFVESEPLPPGWTWGNLDASFASRPGVLSLNRNLAGITMRPSRQGDPVDFSHSVNPPPFDVVNRSRTLAAGSAPTLTIERELEGRTVTLVGGLPAGSDAVSRSVPVGTPVTMTAEVFRRLLAEEGVEVRGGIRFERNVPKGSLVLGRLRGATFGEMLTLCNERSDNFIAESLYLLCSADRYGRGSYSGSQQLEVEFWRSIGVEPGDIRSADGSGLSRENAITPQALTELLIHMREVDSFYRSLPVSGRTGTMRFRLGTDGMIGRVRAKTGTLNGTAALSGYVTTNSGNTVVFSIMANNFTGSTAAIRTRIDEMVTALAAR